MSNVKAFTWKGITFVVRVRQDGFTEYRDALHLGGPWTNVNSTLTNPSIDSRFCKALAKANTELHLQE